MNLLQARGLKANFPLRQLGIVLQNIMNPSANEGASSSFAMTWYSLARTTTTRQIAPQGLHN